MSTSSTPGTKAAHSIRWGILGVGNIARQFAGHLLQNGDARLRGVASRSFNRAQAFASGFGTQAFESYDRLLSSKDIDVVYVATPTAVHKELCLLALSHGKSVLCEKPFTADAASAAEVASCARERRLFCMEAMWMRFNPHIAALRELVAAGAIGSPQSLRAEIGWAKPDSGERSRGDGGAMLSFGCYALSLSWFLLGPPSGFSSHVLRNAHGLDVSCAMLLHYPQTLVHLTASISSTQSNEAFLVGSEGTALVPSPFIDAISLSLRGPMHPQRFWPAEWRRWRHLLANKFPSLFTDPRNAPGSGFAGEIRETMRCLRAGLTESPVMPLDESIAIHETVDRIRGSGLPGAPV